MKAHILVPLFAAFVFTGMARSETPDKPRPDGPPPAGPFAERLKHRIEELLREGKKEEAERLKNHAREMWEHQRGNPQGEHREDAHRGMPPGSPGEREAHLAEAAKHLHAAGINVSPEMLEKLGQRFAGKQGHRQPGSPGERGGSAAGRPPFPPRGDAAPAAGAPLEAMHNEIRTLARQVQELRAMVQREHGGEPSRGERDRGVQRPNEGEHRGDKPQGEHRPDHPAAPEAARERHDGPARPLGDDRPRGEGRPLNPPGNPPPHGDRPHGDAPVPPPAR